MITPCCIFTYREHSHEAVLAARSARVAGLFPVFVVEDILKPINIEARMELEANDVVIIASDFPRPGNLRGIDCIYGMMQVYGKIMEKTGSAQVVKMDSDTMLTGIEAIRFAAQKEYSLFGWSSPEYDFHGSTYVISKFLVDSILGFIRRWKGIPGMANASVPEDQGIFRMAMLLDSENVAVSKYDPTGGFGAFWCWQPKEEFESKFLQRFEAVSFGNRKDQNGSTVSQVESHKAQQSFLKHIEQWRIHSSFDSRRAV